MTPRGDITDGKRRVVATSVARAEEGLRRGCRLQALREGGAEVPPVDQDAQVGVVHHGGGAHEQAAGRHHHLTANI